MSQPQPEPTPAPTPTPQPAPDPTPDPTPADRMFTQAELDAIVRDRVRRVKAEPPADYDDLKAKAGKYDELEAANATELEKAQKKAEDSERKYNEMLAEAKETRLRAAIISEAAKPDRKVVDPEAVVALIDRSELDLDDNGVPRNIAPAMDSLLEARPYLVVTSGGQSRPAPGADQGARGGHQIQLSEDDLQKMSPEEIVQARKDGKLTGLGVAP